jgi:DNA-binding transcriptional regulator YhcF (GntR family)
VVETRADANVPAAEARHILAQLAGSLDRSLPVPLGTQLRGLIEFGIALGELPAGQRLPSVRELAEHVGIAPMTVSNVYRELRLSGLIETRQGAGTFVGDGHQSDGPLPFESCSGASTSFWQKFRIWGWHRRWWLRW